MPGILGQESYRERRFLVWWRYRRSEMARGKIFLDITEAASIIKGLIKKELEILNIAFLDFSVNEDCLNFLDSYGEICVKCNSCGRFDEKTKYEDRLKVYERQLKDNNDFDDWFEGLEEIQRANVKANAEYMMGLIAETKEKIASQA